MDVPTELVTIRHHPAAHGRDGDDQNEEDPAPPRAERTGLSKTQQTPLRATRGLLRVARIGKLSLDLLDGRQGGLQRVGKRFEQLVLGDSERLRVVA